MRIHFRYRGHDTLLIYNQWRSGFNASLIWRVPMLQWICMVQWFYYMLFYLICQIQPHAIRGRLQEYYLSIHECLLHWVSLTSCIYINHCHISHKMLQTEANSTNCGIEIFKHHDWKEYNIEYGTHKMVFIVLNYMPQSTWQKGLSLINKIPGLAKVRCPNQMSHRIKNVNR